MGYKLKGMMKKMEEIIKKAMELEEAGNPAEAIMLIESYDGDISEELWYVKGNCFQDMGRDYEAITCYQESLRINPSGAEYLNNIGLSYLYLDNPMEALYYFEQCIKANPMHVEALLNKAGVQDDYFGDYEDALEAINAAEKLQPDNHLVNYTKANILSDMGSYVPALVYYDKAILLKPDFHNLYNNKGLCYKRMGEYEKALECFNKALELGGEDEVLNNMGLAYHFLGKHEEAIDCFKRCNKIIEGHKNLQLFYPEADI